MEVGGIAVRLGESGGVDDEEEGECELQILNTSLAELVQTWSSIYQLGGREGASLTIPPARYTLIMRADALFSHCGRRNRQSLSESLMIVCRR